MSDDPVKKALQLLREKDEGYDPLLDNAEVNYDSLLEELTALRATHRGHHNVKTKPYRPSNGTEGEMFTSMFCDFCLRDAGFDDERTDEELGAYIFLRKLYPNGCPILAATLGHDVDEPGYPAEWVYDDLPDLMEALATTRCTAFIPDGQALARNAVELVKKYSDAYLIWSEEHKAWWNPGRHGYYPSVSSAGIYTKKEAREILQGANMRRIAVPGKPVITNEYAVPIDALIPRPTTPVAVLDAILEVEMQGPSCPLCGYDDLSPTRQVQSSTNTIVCRQCGGTYQTPRKLLH